MSSSEAALGRCVGDLDRFARDFWARSPLLHGSGRTFDDLLSLRDIDHMLSSMSLRLPAFRLVKEGSTVPASRYTRTGRTGSTTVTGIADPARIFAEFEGGATIVLQGMHR